MSIFRRTPEQPQQERSNAATVSVSAWSPGASVEYRQPTDRLVGGLAAGHEREPLVATITNIAANAIADPAVVLTARRTGTGTPVESHPMLDAFNAFASAGVSASELRMWVSYGLDYAGEAYLYVANGTVTPIVGGRVVILISGDDALNDDGSPQAIAGYRLEDSSGRVVAAFNHLGFTSDGAARLIRIFNPHPLDAFRADSLVARAGLPIDILHKTRQFTKTVIEHTPIAGGILSVRDSIDQDSMEEYVRRLNAAGTTNRGGFLGLDADATLTEFSNSQVGDQWQGVAYRATEDIFAVWRMPQSLVGRGGGATFENQRTERAAWCRDFVLPRLNLIASALNKALRREGVEFAWDTSGLGILKEDYDAGAQRGVRLFAVGAVTVNEVRVLSGLTPLEGPDGEVRLDPAAPSGPSPQARAEVVSPPPFPKAELRAEAEPAAPGKGLEQAWAEAYDGAVTTSEDEIAAWAQAFVNRITRSAIGALHRQAGVRAEGEPPAPVMTARQLFDEALRNKELAADLPGQLATASERVLAALQVAATTHGVTQAAWAAGLPAVRLTVADAVAQRVAQAVGRDGIASTLADVLSATLAEGYEAGDSVGQLAARIQDSWGATGPGELPKHRALVIARTEANGIANTTAFSQMSESGIVEKVRWYSIGDGRTRASHAATAGQVRAIGELFDLAGHPCERPHDPRLPASEAVNCRCRLIPVVE